MAPQCFDLAAHDMIEVLTLRLAREGLDTNDLPRADEPELMRLLSDLGFDSALHRTKMRKAVRMMQESEARKQQDGEGGAPMTKTKTAPAACGQGFWEDEQDERETEPGQPCASETASSSKADEVEVGLPVGSLEATMHEAQKLRKMASLPLGCSASSIAGRSSASFRCASLSIPSNRGASVEIGIRGPRRFGHASPPPRASGELSPRGASWRSSSVTEARSMTPCCCSGRCPGLCDDDDDDVSPRRGRRPQSLSAVVAVPAPVLRVAYEPTVRVVMRGGAPPPPAVLPVGGYVVVRPSPTPPRVPYGGRYA